MTKLPASSPRLFRSDVPPVDLEGDRDAFGHKAYAVALASALLEAEAPFTFGLFGPFGLGKTTVIDELGRQVKGRAAVVVFDAWRYEGDALRRQFLRETAAALVRQHQLPCSWVESNLTELDTSSAVERSTGGPRISKPQLIQFAVRLVPAALLIWLAWKYAPTLGGGDKKEAERILASILIAAATYFVTAFSQTVYVPTEVATTAELKPELFTHKFSDMISDLKNAERLIVVIDNLDRCNADRIEEIFFTLNTFLEPLSVPKNKHQIAIGKDRRDKKDAVFLIAADDEALRKHLNARERLATRGVRRQAGARDDVGDYADEFLRKIFKASITMKQILADDMREFVAHEIDDFCSARKLDPQDAATLVELVTAALKSNPRRIREFGNNLELQLRVIEARQAEGQIVGEISKDVLLVAKMRLLEEEWPASYSMIFRDVRLLAKWYERMAAAEYEEMPDANDERFLAFMNIARGIPDKNLGALLRLKQSAAELALPRYDEFRDALLDGQRDVVEEIVTAEAADPKAYANRLQHIVGEEISSFYFSSARNLIEVALAVEPLRAEDEAIRRLMVKAADSQPLRLELKVSPPAPLFAAAGLLDQTRFNQLIAPWVALDSIYAESPERATAAAAALVPILPRLTDQQKSQLTASLAVEQLKTAIPVYLPLAKAEPDLLPLDFGAFAVEALTDDLDTTSDAFELYCAWLGRATITAPPQQAFADLVVAELSANSPPATEFTLTEEHLQALARAFGRMKNLVTPQTIQNACLLAFPLALAAGRADPLLDLASATSRWTDSASVADELVAAYFNQGTDALLAYAASRSQRLSPNLRTAILKRLQAALLNPATEKDLRSRAAETLAVLDKADEQAFLGNSLPLLIAQGDWGTADELLTQYPDQSKPFEAEIVDKAIERAGAEAPASTAAFSFIERLLPLLSEEQRSVLLGVMSAAVAAEASAPVALAAVDRYASLDVKFKEMRETLVRQLFDAFAQAQTPPPALPDLVAIRADALDPDRRASLVAQFERWITQPGEHQETVAQAAAALLEPSQQERNKVVDAMINAETAAVGNVPLRLALLKAAAGFVGGDGSKAAKRFTARIAAIRAEVSDENAQLVQSLEDLAVL